MYLKGKGDDIALTREHRSSPTPPPLTLRLLGRAGTPHLELVEGEPTGAAASGESLEERILASLAGGPPLSRGALRDRLSVRNLRLGEALERLAEEGRIVRTPDGWSVAGRGEGGTRSPFPAIGMDGNGRRRRAGGRTMRRLEADLLRRLRNDLEIADLVERLEIPRQIRGQRMLR